jgi:sporulation protein YlmC with PRC-barrel domain
MRKSILAATALALAVSTAAFAQNPAPPAPNAAPDNKAMQNTTPAPKATQNNAQAPKDTTASKQTITANGQWQASKFIGLDVYNDKNEKIGDIKELLLDKSGKIDTVAIGVGGFLGMGEHDVAVKFSQLKFVDQPIARTTSLNEPATRATANNNAAMNNNPKDSNRPATTTGTGATVNATTTTNTTAMTSQKRNYPDHALLNATKDQLKAMPQFDYKK